MAVALLAATFGCAAVVFLFAALIDPWGVLPASLPLRRVPISTNARFSFPALARSAKFDAAILGTSTSRLLRPVVFDPLFDAHFVNLSMNSATAWEQTQLLSVFLRAHPHPRAVLIGLDIPWCETRAVYQDRTPRPFPDWMYDDTHPWRGYAHMFTLYAVQEAANQFAVLTGLHRRRYGLDGYTDFTPPDATYDPARAHAHVLAEGVPDELGADPRIPPDAHDFPAMALLRTALARVPADTPKILFFVPYLQSYQGAPGTLSGAMWAECKRRVAAIAATTPDTILADFMRPSPITADEAHYWDPKHYRVGVAERLAHDLAGLAAGVPAGPDAAILADTLAHSPPSR